MALVTVIGASIFLLGFAVLLVAASSGYFTLIAILYIGLTLAVDGLLLGGFLLDELDPRVRLGLLVSGGLIIGLAAGQLFNVPYGYWP